MWTMRVRSQRFRSQSLGSQAGSQAVPELAQVYLLPYREFYLRISRLSSARTRETGANLYSVRSYTRAKMRRELL